MSHLSDQVSPLEETKAKMIEHAPMPIVFDGFSRETFAAIIEDANVDRHLAYQAFPKGISDLVVAIHIAGDDMLAKKLAAEELDEMKYSERVSHAVFRRLSIAGQNKELVRRASTFFALPQNVAAGTKCIWHTADTIWNSLGDTSDDLNWYSKRTILSGVYSSSLLYWLGDESEAQEATKQFIDRRIANVMQFEKTKAEVKRWRVYEVFRKGPGHFINTIKAPHSTGLNDMPGQRRK